MSKQVLEHPALTQLKRRLAAVEFPPLSPKIVTLLLHGDREGYYASRSEVVMAIALGAANAGWTQAAFMNAIMDPRYKGGDSLRVRASGKPRPANYAPKEALRAWVKAQRRVGLQPPIDDRAEALAQIDALIALEKRWPWPGRTGTTDSLVLLDHLMTARRVGKLSHNRSVREAAEACDIDSIGTVSKARKRLRNAGWLVQLRKGVGSDAATFRVQAPRTCPDGKHTDLRFTHSSSWREESVSTWDSSFLDALRRNDVWRHDGLGRPCLRCYLKLIELQAVTARQLAEALTRTKVRHHLARLKQHGLATLEKDIWRPVIVDVPILDALAVKLGTAGHGRRQHARHEDERQEHERVLRTMERRQAGMSEPLDTRLIA